MSTHQLRVVVEDFSARPWRHEYVLDIDTADYDPENRTIGSLVWDGWAELWRNRGLDRTVANLRENLNDNQRVSVYFDSICVADEHTNGVSADLFTASWVARNDMEVAAL